MTPQEILESLASTAKLLADLGVKMNDFNRKMDELRASQAKTDEQLNKLEASQAKTDEQLNKLEASQAKTDEQMNKADKRLQRLEKLVDATCKKLDGMGVTQGEISEDLFDENFEDLFHKEGKNIYRVSRNFVVKGKCEYDLIGVNGSEVFVGEIKTRLTVSHIEEFITKRLQTFRSYLPEYNNYKLYGFVGGRVLAKGALECARSNGLYVMKQDSKGHAKMIYNQGIER